MTFSDIDTAIQEEMQLDSGLVSDAERLRFINSFLDEVSNLSLLEKVYSQASVSTQYVDLPSDYSKLKRLYWNDGTNTRPLSPVQESADFTSSGTPVGYVLEGEQVRLYPVPTTAGTLRWVYAYKPTYFTTTTGGSEPDIPSNWHNTIVDYACFRSHRKNGNMLSSAQYYRDYKEKFNGNIKSYISYLNTKVYSAVEDNTPSLGSDTFIPPDVRW